MGYNAMQGTPASLGLVAVVTRDSLKPPSPWCSSALRCLTGVSTSAWGLIISVLPALSCFEEAYWLADYPIALMPQIL